jgi:bacterial leucyl aminopeptidase
MSRYVRTFLFSALLLSLTTIAVFQTGHTKADTSEFWISVDSTELQYIVANRGSKDAADLGKLKVSKVLNNIAIVPLNDLQMEELSRSMHDNFHKCSGYVAHTSEADAIEWVRNMESARTDTALVNYTINNPITVDALLAETSEPYIRQVILDLSAFPNRRYNQSSGLQSANWIKDKWSSLVATQNRGLFSVDFFNHPTSVSPQPSVIFTITGARFPDEIIVLGAHQDSINSSSTTASAPGADDDASGIACLTEVIRVMVETGYRPDRTVQFMAYAAEEVGLRGSNAIATAYRNENKNVIGVLQLDMTNFRGTQGFDVVMMTDFTNAAQNQFLRDLLTTYQPGLTVGNSSCGYACSDHASWHNKSYPASFPFEAPFNSSNNAIHTANDTLARSNNNANHSVSFAKLAMSYVAELAKGCRMAGPRCQPPS